MGPAEHRRQPRHDEGAASREEPRTAVAVLLPDRDRLRSGQRLGHRRRQPAQSATDLQEGPQLFGLSGEPVSRSAYRAPVTRRPPDSRPLFLSPLLGGGKAGGFLSP